jgi:imidazole glycerol-phosphate synthase subunit HisH
MITIIDYGLGNINSIKKAFYRLGINCQISDQINEINKAEKVILPGVGHFKKGMEKIKSKGLDICLDELVNHRKVPVLGICLGMQLMTKASEEGNINGFGWINAKVKLFNFSKKQNKIKIPHMGWNSLSICDSNNKLFSGISKEDLFYFVHSYYVECEDNNISSITEYGSSFASSFQSGNVFGVQFHPEKSHSQGLKILDNFAKI